MDQATAVAAGDRHSNMVVSSSSSLPADGRSGSGGDTGDKMRMGDGKTHVEGEGGGSSGGGGDKMGVAKVGDSNGDGNKTNHGGGGTGNGDAAATNAVPATTSMPTDLLSRAREAIARAERTRVASEERRAAGAAVMDEGKMPSRREDGAAVTTTAPRNETGRRARSTPASAGTTNKPAAAPSSTKPQIKPATTTTAAAAPKKKPTGTSSLPLTPSSKMLYSRVTVRLIALGFPSTKIDAIDLIHSGVVLVNDRVEKNPYLTMTDSDIIRFKDVPLWRMLSLTMEGHITEEVATYLCTEGRIMIDKLVVREPFRTVPLASFQNGNVSILSPSAIGWMNKTSAATGKNAPAKSEQEPAAKPRQSNNPSEWQTTATLLLKTAHDPPLTTSYIRFLMTRSRVLFRNSRTPSRDHTRKFPVDTEFIVLPRTSVTVPHGSKEAFEDAEMKAYVTAMVDVMKENHIQKQLLAQVISTGGKKLPGLPPMFTPSICIYEWGAELGLKLIPTKDRHSGDEVELLVALPVQQQQQQQQQPPAVVTATAPVTTTAKKAVAAPPPPRPTVTSVAPPTAVTATTTATTTPPSSSTTPNNNKPPYPSMYDNAYDSVMVAPSPNKTALPSISSFAAALRQVPYKTTSSPPPSSDGKNNTDIPAISQPGVAHGTKSLEAILIDNKLASDSLDAFALCRDSSVLVDGQVEKNVKTMIRIDQQQLVTLIEDVAKIRKFVPNATLPYVDSISWHDPLKRSLIWSFAGMFCFVCNVTLEALSMGGTTTTTTTTTEELIKLFDQDGGTVFMRLPAAAQELLEGMSMVMRTRAVHEGQKLYESSRTNPPPVAQGMPYKCIYKTKGELLVGPHHNDWIFWPLVGAYKDETKAKRYVTLFETNYLVLLNLSIALVSAPFYDANINMLDTPVRLAKYASLLRGTLWASAFLALTGGDREAGE